MGKKPKTPKNFGGDPRLKGEKLSCQKLMKPEKEK